MTALIYTLFVLPISRLPMRALYVLSDFLFILVFYGVKYRRRVVEENVARSFPEKSPEAHAQIVRDFYHHFCDLIVESFKGFTISNEEILKRYRVENPEILAPYFAANRSVVVAGGHTSNWEWLAIALQQQISHHAVAIYKPLSNKTLEKKMQSTRGKYGLKMLPIPQVPAFFKTATAKGSKPFAVLFGCDQSPGDPRKAHWMKFLGQDTGVPFGAEKYAKEFDLPVFFGSPRRVSRGHYLFPLSLITGHPRETETGFIVEEATRRLETMIRKEPPSWLWTHRRWKHRRPEGL